jgi:LDH2 family malate/lactate/ureidoglycolate dehydrogenase
VGFGVPPQDAETVSDCLIEANLMGLDTHGVLRLKLYMDRVQAGGNNPRPDMRVVRESACTALLDADNALGPVGAKRGMEVAIAKAATQGLGMCLVRHCNHYGPAGHYARMALAQDMIGVSLTNVLASMPPTGGAEARIGNNAYALAFPTDEEPPVVVDGATSMSSWGTLFLCNQTGQNLPEGCYLDAEGMPTVSPKAVLNGGALLPFGGHKGYGLAAAIELLTGMLAEAELDQDVPHPYKRLADPGANTFAFQAIRLDAFVDAGAFRRRMDEWVRFIRDTRKAPGVERLWLPGEKEAVVRAERLRTGIPLNPAMVEELRALAEAAGVEFGLG